MVQPWARAHELVADEKDTKGRPVPLRVTMGIIGLTRLELHQRPVAQSERTLATACPVRDRGNLAEYQKVVADALVQEVAMAKARGAMAALSGKDLRRAQKETGAGRRRVRRGRGHVEAHGRRRARHRDERLRGQHRRPAHARWSAVPGVVHAVPGLPVRAGTPPPSHGPGPGARPDRGAARADARGAVGAAVRRPARLADPLGRHSKAVLDDARATVTDDDRALATRFLNRELDLR